MPTERHRMPAEDKITKTDSEDVEESPDKPNVTLAGTVDKIIPAVNGDPEKVQISVQGADDLYREVRIENTLQDREGKPVALKEGTEVDVTIEADQANTKAKE